MLGKLKKLGIKKRQIIIEHDGNSAKIIKAEVSGTFELNAILIGLLQQLGIRQEK